MLQNSDTNSRNQETLTPGEQRIYFELLRRRVMELRGVAAITGNYQAARTQMVRLVKKGFALRVHRGLYAAVPPEYAGTDYEPDRYLVAFTAGGENGALAFHTALELHGVAHSDFNEVFVLRQTARRGFSYRGISYRFVSSKKIFGVEKIIREGIQIAVTDRERTFLDCLRKPDYCGGLEEVIKSTAVFHTLNPDTLREYLKRFGEQSLMQRAGFVLSLMQRELRIPEEFIAELKSEAGERVYYLHPGNRRT